MILLIVCIKYKPAYEVTLAGEILGYVKDKNYIETKLNKFINDTNNNIAFREISENPVYALKFINKDKKTEEKSVMLAIENATTTTYRNFAVTADGEQKAVVHSETEAEDIINQIKEGLDGTVDLKLGITEIYTTNDETVSEAEAMN